MLHALHKSIETVFQPLHESCLKGIVIRTIEGKKLRCHLLLSSYIADIPEAEDLLSVKQNTSTESPCHRCIVRKENLLFCTNELERTAEKTRQLLRSITSNVNTICSSRDGVEEVNSLSMFSIPPVLSNFPLVGIHESVDIYAISRFEPLHNFPLGISKMLKECS